MEVERDMETNTKRARNTFLEVRKQRQLKIERQMDRKQMEREKNTHTEEKWGDRENIQQQREKGRNGDTKS